MDEENKTNGIYKMIFKRIGSFFRKYYKQIAFIMISIFMFIKSLSLDTGHILPFDFLLMNEEPKDVASTVISMQVTLVSTSIAIVALLSGLTNKKIYSKSVTEFITKDQPFLFKHRNIITALISMILVNYFFWVKSLYNCEVAVFIISLFLVLIMCWEIFGVFYGDKNTGIQIKKYILNNCDDEYLDDVYTDLLLYVDTNNIIKSKELIAILYELLNKAIDKNDETLIKRIQDILILYYKSVFKKNDKLTTIDSIQYLSLFYELAKDRKMILIWEYCSPSFYNALSYLQYTDLTLSNFKITEDYNFNYTCLGDFRESLYKNVILNNADNPGKTFYTKYYQLRHFTYNVYYYLVKNNIVGFSHNDNYKILLFNNLNRNLKQINSNSNKDLLIIDELITYTKALVLEEEYAVLSLSFFRILKLNNALTEYQKIYFISVFLYIYHLLIYEQNNSFTGNVEELYSTFLKESDTIKSFMLDFDYTIIINNTRWISYLVVREDYKHFDKVIEDCEFFVLSSIYETNFLLPQLKQIINTNNFYYFYEKFNKANEELLLKRLNCFYICFTGINYTNAELVEKLQKLNNALELLKAEYT